METRGPVRGFPKESEFPVTMQAISLDRYHISFLGGTYTFHKNDLLYMDKKKDISWVAQEILHHSKKHGLTQISFCIISMLEGGFKTSMWMFVLDAEFKAYSKYNEEAVITFYEVNIGKKDIYRMNLSRIIDLPDYSIEIENNMSHESKEELIDRLSLYSDLRDQWYELLCNHSRKDTMVNYTGTNYADYLYSMFERRAVEDIDSGRYPIKKRSDKEKTIRNWIADFKKDKLSSVANKDQISDLVKGVSLHNKRRLMLITAYYLSMSFDETRLLFELSGEKFEPLNDNEFLIMILFRDGLYDNEQNAKVIDKILEENNFIDIYNFFGFMPEEEEEKTKKTKNKKKSNGDKGR